MCMLNPSKCDEGTRLKRPSELALLVTPCSNSFRIVCHVSSFTTMTSEAE